MLGLLALFSQSSELPIFCRYAAKGLTVCKCSAQAVQPIWAANGKNAGLFEKMAAMVKPCHCWPPETRRVPLPPFPRLGVEPLLHRMESVGLDSAGCGQQ